MLILNQIITYFFYNKRSYDHIMQTVSNVTRVAVLTSRNC